jgi:hypothetical protein
VVASAVRLLGRLPNHDDHDKAQERANGGNALNEETDGGAAKLRPGVQDRRVMAVDARGLHRTIGHVGIVVLMHDVLARNDGGNTGKECEGRKHNRQPCEA